MPQPSVRRADLFSMVGTLLSTRLAGGADLQVVKERLGHSSIVTTQKYLGTLDETDETAIDALSRIRTRGRKPARRSTRRSA
jgi:integrase